MARVRAQFLWGLGKSSVVKNARSSRRNELRYQYSSLGSRLGSLVGDTFAAIKGQTGRETVVALCDTFASHWTTDAAISAAFDDLCKVARNPASAGKSAKLVRWMARLVKSAMGLILPPSGVETRRLDYADFIPVQTSSCAGLPEAWCGAELAMNVEVSRDVIDARRSAHVVVHAAVLSN